MQRHCVLSLASYRRSARAAGLAGPLSLNPQCPAQRATLRRAVGRGACARAAYARQPWLSRRRAEPRARYAAARTMGGGFFEFLFRGPPARRPALPAAPAYAPPGYDLGPGMADVAISPGRAVMDPRFIRQEVAYDGKEAAGTIIINTRERLLYLVQGGGTRDPLRHRRRPARLHLVGRASHLAEARMAGLDAAGRDAAAPAGSSALHAPAGPTIRLARARCISARRSIASTARTSPGPSARGLVRLHPHAQRGRHRPLQPRRVGTKVVVI